MGLEVYHKSREQDPCVMTQDAASKASPLSPPLANPDVKHVLDAVQATMKVEQYCFLITLDRSGQPQARMVAALAVEPDLRVWVVTSPETRKVKEIQEDDRTTMAFYDSKGEGYATLMGKSRLVSDNDQKRKVVLLGLQVDNNPAELLSATVGHSALYCIIFEQIVPP